MGFKELPAAERLRILRSEGGYQGWLREQARARAGTQHADTDPAASGLVEVACRVPKFAAPLLLELAQALRDADTERVRAACQALQSPLGSLSATPQRR